MAFNLNRWYWTAAAIPLSASCYYLALLVLSFHRLPTSLPIHFDLEGEPNGWLNRYAWMLMSPMLMAGILSLVFTTAPAPNGAITNLVNFFYWGACGLLMGCFVAIVRAAARQERISFVSIIVWLVAVPVLAAFVALLLRPWWRVAVK